MLLAKILNKARPHAAMFDRKVSWNIPKDNAWGRLYPNLWYIWTKVHIYAGASAEVTSKLDVLLSAFAIFALCTHQYICIICLTHVPTRATCQQKLRQMKKGPIIFSAIATAILAASCSTTRVLQDGEYRLAKNKISVSNDKKFNANSLEPYLKQKPNSYFLFDPPIP